jgi:hypothetical protein
MIDDLYAEYRSIVAKWCKKYIWNKRKLKKPRKV